MSTLQNMLITSDASQNDFNALCELRGGGPSAMNNVINYIAGVISGAGPGADFKFNVGAVRAVGTITQTSTGAANDETLTVCGVTFTAKTSGATGDQWNRSDTVATSAANLAAAINASANTNIYVSAAAVLGVVTITMLTPGVLGNIPTITEACANTTCATFAGGLDGTAYTIAF